MSELYEKSLLKLELDQVLNLLAECAGSMEGKAACRNAAAISHGNVYISAFFTFLRLRLWIFQLSHTTRKSHQEQHDKTIICFHIHYHLAFCSRLGFAAI